VSPSATRREPFAAPCRTTILGPPEVTDPSDVADLTNMSMYRGLIETAPDAMLAVSESGIIILVNAQTEVLFGYPRAELLGQTVEMLVPEVAREIHPRHRSRYFEHPQTRPMGAGMELVGRRRDGTTFPAEISLSAIATDDGTLVSAAIRDGTARNQAAIVNSSTDAIIAKDLQGTITSWNHAAEVLYGYRAAEIIGRDVRILIPEELHEEREQLVARVRSGELVQEHETFRLRSDGTRIAVAKTMSPIRDEAGAIIGVASISRDITERRRLQAERQALEDRLHRSERLESLGQLAGGIAHDFNNLLSVILNYASFVAEEIVDQPAASADVEEIRRAAERAARLTQQLLIVGRRETTQPEVLDLDGIVGDLSSLLSRTIGEHIDLIVVRSLRAPILRADRGQVEQVLINLVVNARDAMPDGGSITIESVVVDIDEDLAQIIADIGAGAYVQLSVSDTGSGMTSEVLDHAFEPFFTTKPKEAGSGLGLATVYGIVTEAGGQITIYSEPNLGTTVRVYLPLVSATPETPIEVEEHPRRPQASGTILVVEDEGALLKMAVRILRRNGFTVLEAIGPAEALALAAEHDFDVLLTDVIMPRGSGPDLAAEILSSHPEVRVLFMSGYSKGVLGPGHHLDDDVALIQKPFTERMLIDRLSELCADDADPDHTLGGVDE